MLIFFLNSVIGFVIFIVVDHERKIFFGGGFFEYIQTNISALLKPIYVSTSTREKERESERVKAHAHTLQIILFT